MKDINEKMILIIVGLFILGWCIMVVWGFKNSKKAIAEHKQHIEEVYGDIQFKGKVLNVHEIERWGRIYGIMCVKLDYSNINSFYKFDKISCLKIRDGIAVLPTGPLGSKEDVRYILDAAYIEVNIDNSGKMCFTDSVGNEFVQDYLYYGNGNLLESDLSRCSDCSLND